MIKIDVNIGDTILVGRFKNKAIVVKEIGEDEFGMPTINGRKVVNFRIKSKGKTEMKKSELKQIIREEIKKLKESNLSPNEKKELLKVKERVKKEIPYFRNKEFILWKSGNDYYVQETSNGEPFGHEFKVDFRKKEIVPST